MIRNVGVAVAATIALLVPATGAHAVTAERGASIAGSWKGGVYGDNGGSAGYTAKVSLKKNAQGRWVGRVSYPGTCSGKWSFTGKSGGAFKFKERITNDPGEVTCATPVNVQVKREGAKLRVRWTEVRSGDSATMLAKKT